MSLKLMLSKKKTCVLILFSFLLFENRKIPNLKMHDLKTMPVKISRNEQKNSKYVCVCQLNQQCSSSRKLVILFIVSSCYCFRVRGIVSVVFSFVLSKGSEPLM